MGYKRYEHIRSFGKTDVGQVRQHNEDSIGSAPELASFFVADGMGGEDAGDIASSQVIQSLQKMASRHPDGKGIDNLHRKEQTITLALQEANRAIRKFVREQNLNQSGSTAVALAFDFNQPENALVAHVGDSRIYRLRDGILEPLTTDHSVAAAAGIEREADVPFMFRGMITRAVGIRREVEPTFQKVDVHPGDLYLLCSDGLTGMIDDKTIQRHLNTATPDTLEATTDALIDDANAAGGKDNISVYLVHVSEFTLPATIMLEKHEVPEDPIPPEDVPTDDTEEVAYTATTVNYLPSGSLSPEITTIARSKTAPLPTPQRNGFSLLREKSAWIILGSVLLGLLVYLGYLGFFKPAPEIDSAAFPKPLDNATVLSQLSNAASETASKAMPPIDLKDGQAIRDARQTGEWDLIRDAMTTGGKLPEGTLMQVAKNGIARWARFYTDPELSTQAYTRLYQDLQKTGVDDLFSQHANILESLPADPHRRATALSQYAARFDQNIAPMLDALVARSEKITGLFSMGGQPIPTSLTQVYPATAEELNLKALRAILPEIKNSNRQLTQLAQDLRETGSSPTAIAAIDLTPYLQLEIAATEWINRLNLIIDRGLRDTVKEKFRQFPQGIRSVGEGLLKNIEQAQVDLNIARGAFPTPLSSTQMYELYPNYRKLTQATHEFRRWNLQNESTP